MIQKTSLVAEWLARGMLFILLAVILILVFLQVILRYLFGQSIVWSEEVSRYAFVWATFIGASLASRQGLHVAVGLVIDRVPPSVQKWLSVFSNLLVLLFAFVSTAVTGQVAIRAYHQQTAILQIPMAIPYAGMCFGFLLITLQQLPIVLRAMRGEKVTWETNIDGNPIPKE